MSDDRRYAAVLLDFRGILVGFPEDDWWIREAFARIRRVPRDGEPAAIRASFDRVSSLPSFREGEALVDLSLEDNRDVVVGRLTAAGIEPEIAHALWELDCDPVAWPVFDDAPQVIQALRAREVRLALVSNFHVDLRPHLRANGIELDAHVISFEHGFQKPDPRMFTTALEHLGAAPKEALMVGDNAHPDGGAALVGIDTLLLPDPPRTGSRGLDVVLRMVG